MSILHNKRNSSTNPKYSHRISIAVSFALGFFQLRKKKKKNREDIVDMRMRDGNISGRLPLPLHIFADMWACFYFNYDDKSTHKIKLK